MSRLRRTASEQPLLARARERPTRQQRPSIAKNKHINKNIVKRKSAGGSEINVEFGVDIYTPLYVKLINNKDLLYSTGNYRQYLVKPSEEKNLENGSITESFCCIPEANATVLQKNKKKGIRSFQAGVPWWLSGAHAENTGFHPWSRKTPHATKCLSLCSRAWELQLRSPHAATGEACMPYTPCSATKVTTELHYRTVPSLAAAREQPVQPQRPSTARNK